MLDPSRIQEDALCYHNETLAKHPEIHNKIGLKNCRISAKRKGECKNAFRLNFSKELVDRYAEKMGFFDKHGEWYWKGEQFYKVTAEDFFYRAFNISKRSKREQINDFLTIWQYMVGQRAPTMNITEKLM